MEDTECNLLVAIIDLGMSQSNCSWRNDHTRAVGVLEAVIAFVNTHLMMRTSNRLAVMACDATSSEWIYPLQDSSSMAVRQQDGQHELFSEVERAVRQRIAEILAERAANEGETRLAGAMARALCYISRLDKEQNNRVEKMNARIFIITASGDGISQYMKFMNVFFTAQKQNVLLDVCSLEEECGLLQQGCDITGGQYLHVPQPQGLLQYLLWVFLPGPPLRKKLALPPPVRVDYRAACFCHSELVDIGFVCSVCLSIFCKFSPICTTCHTVFKSVGALAMKSKKKKKTA